MELIKISELKSGDKIASYALTYPIESTKHSYVWMAINKDHDKLALKIGSLDSNLNDEERILKEIGPPS
jgi:hypothetical protein